MNVQLKKTDDVNGIITVEVSEADYAEKVAKELKNIRAKADIPGFRKGSVPMPQIKKRYEKAVKSDVLNDEVYKAVIKYIQDEKLHLLGEPMPVDVKEVNLDDKDYTFEYEVGFAPALNVEVDKKIKLPYYKIQVTDAMIDDQDKNFTERFGAQVPGEEADARAVIKGSLQQLNADGSVNTNEGAVQVVSAIIAPFTFTDKEEAEKFLGKKVNDKVVFNPYKSCNGSEVELASMLNLDRDIAKDVKDDFEFAISEIIVVKPAEHNQEFFDNVAGKDKVHDEAEYREFIKKMIEQQFDGESRRLFDYTAQKYFLDKNENMQLPVEFLKKWLVGRNKELTSENIDAEFEQMLPSLKWQLISENIATKLDVKVEEKDIMDYTKALAFNQYMRYGITNMDAQTIENAAKHILSDQNQRNRIIDTVTEQKLFNAVRGAVTVKTEEVSVEKFNEIASGK